MLIKPQTDPVAKIKVVGVGGGGGNAINTMISQHNIEGVEFLSVNTDAQALKNSLAPIQLQLGEELTRGLGVGGNPVLGEQAAEESVDMVHEHMTGADMVFVASGMGGGTGTGASPVIAGIAKNLGALTVAIVTKPFNFEGRRRMEIALEGIDKLKDKVDTLIVVPNQRLLDVTEKNISFIDAMRMSDDVLGQAVKSISSLITQSGFINVDFNDVKSIMLDAGTAWMGMGTATGENRAVEAAKEAMSSPLLEISINGAEGVLFNILGGMDLSMHEIDTAAQMISEVVDPNANIRFGATIDESIQEEIRITILATGFDEAKTMQFTSPMGDQFGDQAGMTGGVKSDDTGKTSGVSDLTSDTPQKSAKKTTPHQDNSDDLGLDDDELETPAFLRRK